MPLSSRPLFLVPSLMRALPDVGAVMVDLGDLEADDVTATSACAAANALVDQLEPLIVEANLAGYEITVIAATTGTATTPCLVINLEAFLVDAANTPWNNVVTGVNGNPFGANVKAALALRFEPRLAMREAVDEGSVLPSSYGIAFPTPSGWLGSVDPNQGGWLVTTTSTVTTLPGGLTTIAGRPGNSNTAATALVNAIRAAATARWQAHGREDGQLANCALAPLFDTSTWRYPAGDIGAHEAAALIDAGLWRATSGWVPSYAELAGLTLRELMEISRGSTGGALTVEQIRSALRRELIRRQLVDPAAIEGSGLREGELGPRFDELYGAIETFGSKLFAADLFRMLELGLMSLNRRDAAEEMLPALVEREWTDLIVTGFYDSVGTITEIPSDELIDEQEARSWFASVAAEAAVLSVNQAGDHIEAYWHERRWDPASSNPTTIVTWFGGGDRDHSAGGLVFDIVWVSERAGEEAVEGTLSFVEVDGTCEVVADWGPTVTLRRRSQPREVVPPGEDVAEEPETDLVRPFLSEAEIDALSDEVSDRIRTAERYSLHPSEVVLLDAVVGRIAADLHAIAGSLVNSTTERLAMCENLATAFGYFVRNARPSEHAPPAREYVQEKLLSMDGNNTPLDSWINYPPKTYLHALARSHAEMRCDAITVCLGMEQQDLDWFGKDHRYQNKFKVSLSPNKGVKDVGFDHVTKEVVEKLAEKGPLVLSKLSKLRKVLGVGPAPQFDIIEAEFQKIEPYPDVDWPGTAATPVSMFFDGYVAGMGVAGSVGMSVTSESEWSEVNTLGDPWSPDDFAGPFWIVAQYWGASVFDLERVVETPVNSVRKRLGFDGPVRASGEYNYIQFITTGKPDAWSVSRDFVNSVGLHAELGGGVSGGELWRRGNRPAFESELDSGPPKTSTHVSFDVGRSELNAVGRALLHDVAAARLHELALPSTTIEVVGHASFGDARPLYNLTLSQRRAVNVVRELRAYLGPLYAVRPERTSILGLGDQQAEDDGGSAEGWRRVDVFINGDHAVQFATGAE